MRKTNLSAVVIALCIGFSGVAHAAVVTEDIGTLGDANRSASYGYDPITAPDFKLDSAGTGTFKVDFNLVDPAIKTATAFTASATIGVALKDFTFGLYNASNTLLKQVDQTSAISPNGSTVFSYLDFANVLRTGGYYLLLTVTAGNAGQVINGNINIAPAPIPASLPMFGAALAGLLVVQLRNRKCRQV